MANNVTGIYKIISPINKVYIGQSRNISRRIRQHRHSLSLGMIKLGKSIKEYGFAAHKFEVVYKLPKDISQECLDNYETFVLNQFKEGGVEMLNIKEGGSHGKHSIETIEKMKRTTKERGNGYKKGCASTMKGKFHTPESIEKMKQSHKGAISWMKGKNHTAEAIEKMSKFQKGRKKPPRSEEHRKNISLAHLGKKCPLLSKKVICTKTGTIYISIGDAAKANNINYQMLLRYLRGERRNKTSLKYYIDAR